MSATSFWFSLTAQRRGCHVSPAWWEPPRRLSCELPLDLAPIAAETPSAQTEFSSSEQTMRSSKGSICFGISSRERAGVMPQSECATLVDDATFCVFMKASSAVTPTSPRDSLERTSSEVSFGTSWSSLARNSPSSGLSSMSRRSRLRSVFLSALCRARTHPQISITRAGLRTFHDLRFSSSLLIAASSFLISLTSNLCR
mmetsp:Transcript_82071/g.163434  ORF Transcript_82071/g.163434 Transcript_82071/m.163434 type:complete len:200 (-) Transcript_82071:1547-2146(-)